MLVALIGLPGSGKSTIGRHLSRRLQVPFWDSDRFIEDRLGCSVREYFEREGEARFRDLESEVLAELTQARDGVLSTGGGSVLRPENRGYLRQRSTVVYLNSSPDDLIRRLRHDRNRPLLQVSDPMAKLRDLHSRRDPLYRETAHLVVDTGRPSVTKLTQLILARLGLSSEPQGTH